MARRQPFRDNPELQQFVLPDVQPTGRNLGVGSYGSVEELQVKGLVCAGKRLHETLLERGNEGVLNIERKFLEECQVMTKMRHPHIVQFLGLCYLQGSTLPVLVMERMDSSLDDLLEGAPGLPLALKRSLLADVVRGLLYLHTRNPPVVHRDLSSKNILLTSALVAKISDLGNARIVPSQLARSLTCLPGTMVYMPPEAFHDGSRYGPPLDIFSYGHLALFTLTQVFPGSLLPSTFADPERPDRLLGRSELERRSDYIQSLHEQLGEQHPLVQLVHQCLRNDPDQRPSAEELLQQLEATRVRIERSYGSYHFKVQSAMMSVEEREMKEKDHEIEHLQQELHQLQGDRVQVRQLATQLQQKDAQINRQQRQIQTLNENSERLQAEVDAKDTQLQQKDGQLQQQGTELRERANQINRHQRELQTLRENKGRLLQQAQEKDVEISRQQRELQTLRDQNAAKDGRLTAMLQQLHERDAEINRLRRELTDQTATKDESVATLPSPSRQPLARPPSGLQLPLTLRWRQHKDLPCGMSDPHCVIVEGKLYIGGGVTYTDDKYTVWQYDSGQWSKLKQYKYESFSMAAVKRQLMLVGGADTSTVPYKPTSDIAVWDREGASHTWTHPYPPMPTPRDSPAVATYNQWLVVAGGKCDYHIDLATVEVLNTDNHQWLSASSLPVKCSHVTTAILQDELYLVGGTLKKTLVANLPDIIHSNTSATTKPWRTLSAPPLERSAAITVHGALLAVAGCHGNKRSTASTAIHVYQPATNSWSKVGDLPSPRSSCACTVLHSGELLVAGGWDSNGKRTVRVDVAVM